MRKNLNMKRQALIIVFFLGLATSLSAQRIGVVCGTNIQLEKGWEMKEGYELRIGGYEERLQGGDSLKVFESIQKDRQTYYRVNVLSGTLTGTEGWVWVEHVCTDQESYEEFLAYLDRKAARDIRVAENKESVTNTIMYSKIIGYISVLTIFLLPLIYKSKPFPKVKFHFYHLLGKVTACEIRNEVNFRGGGGSISTVAGRVIGSISDISSTNTPVTDFWVKFQNGKEQNHKIAHMIPIKLHQILLFIGSKSNQKLAIRNNETGDVIRFGKSSFAQQAYTEGYNPTVSIQLGASKFLNSIFPIITSLIILILSFYMNALGLANYDGESGNFINTHLLNILVIISSIFYLFISIQIVKKSEHKFKNYLFHHLTPFILCLAALFLSQLHDIIPNTFEYNEANPIMVWLRLGIATFGWVSPFLYFAYVIYNWRTLKKRVMGKLDSRATSEYSRQFEEYLTNVSK